MMFFQDAQFPHCGLFIRGPRIETLELISPEIYAALLECCESEKLVKQALAKGTYLNVRIKVLKRHGFIAKNIGGVYMGECDPEHLNTVLINTYVAQGFENDRTRAVFLNEPCCMKLFTGPVFWVVNQQPSTTRKQEVGLSTKQAMQNFTVATPT